MNELQQTGLSTKQKELLEVVTRLAGAGAFDETDENLKETGLQLSLEQVRALSAAFFARSREQQKEDFRHIDQFLIRQGANTLTAEQLDKTAEALFARSIIEERREFAFLDRRLEESGVHLTAAQSLELRTALLQFSQQEQKQQFAQLNDCLINEGLAIAGEVLIDLSECLFARSRAEHLVEFELKDEQLVMPEHEELYAFNDAPVPPPPVLDELDAIASPTVLDSDRNPLDTIETNKIAQSRRRAADGIIGRMTRAVGFPHYSANKPDGSRVPIVSTENIFGVLMLALPLFALFTVPGMIKSQLAGKTTVQLQREQIEMAELDDRADSAEVDRVAQLAALSFESTIRVQSDAGSYSGPRVADAPATNADTTNQLASARDLAKSGQLGPAIICYEGFLAENPDFIPARIELIKVLLVSKQRKRAQKLCIQSLKRNLAAGDHNIIWELMRKSFGI